MKLHKLKTSFCWEDINSTPPYLKRFQDKLRAKLQNLVHIQMDQSSWWPCSKRHRRPRNQPIEELSWGEPWICCWAARISLLVWPHSSGTHCLEHGIAIFCHAIRTCVLLATARGRIWNQLCHCGWLYKKTGRVSSTFVISVTLGIGIDIFWIVKYCFVEGSPQTFLWHTPLLSPRRPDFGLCQNLHTISLCNNGCYHLKLAQKLFISKSSLRLKIFILASQLQQQP